MAEAYGNNRDENSAMWVSLLEHLRDEEILEEAVGCDGADSDENE